MKPNKYIQTLITRLGKNPFRKDTTAKLVSRKQLNRRSFIAFASFFGLNLVGYLGWRWLYQSPEEKASVTGGAKRPLRKALEKNELIFKNTFSNDHLVKTYPVSMAAKDVRVNSTIGMDDADFNPAAWQLIVHKKNGDVLKITLHELMQLPKTEIVFDFKCVEGWDQVSHWGGVRFKDFVDHYQLHAEAMLNYVGLATPDGGYYVGLERAAALHPQTMLAYEVNNQLLPPEHGQPLRLIVPVKYGIKNLKRIGTITFNDTRPPDYWAEQGYDYYSGL